MKKTIMAVNIGALFALPVSLFAQEIQNEDERSVETIQVIGVTSKFSALKSDTPIMQTARSVSIETSDAFLNKGALTLDDTLAYSAGVVGDTFGFSTRGDFANVRGFDAPEYRDGMQSLSGNYNNARPEIYTLEQVEVLKGPASVLFGPGAPGGIVNIVSKRPTLGKDNEVRLDLGNNNRRQIATDIHGTTPNDDLLMRFVGLYRNSDTQIAQVKDDSFVLAPSFTYYPTDYTEITLLADYTKRESDTAQQFLPLSGSLLQNASGLKTDPTVYVGEPGFNRYDTESWALTLLAEHQINEMWSVDVSSRYRDGESQYRQTWISFIGDGVPRLDDAGNGPRSWFLQNGFSTQFQIDARARAKFDVKATQHNLLIGVSHQRIDNQNDSSFLYGLDFSTGIPIPQGGLINVFAPVYGFTPSLPPIQQGIETQDRILGLYVHDEVIWNKWVFNAGIRFDDVKQSNINVSNQENESSISVSALYQFDNGFRPYINYAESFQPVYGIDSVTQKTLKPQQGEQIEAGIKYQPSKSDHLVTAAYFDIELNNLTNPNGLPNAPSQQEGVSSVDGFELEAILNFNEVNVDASFTLFDSEDPNGNQRASIPERLASIWINYIPADLPNFRSGIGFRHVGENESTGLSVITQEPQTIATASYSVLDLMLGYTIDNWDFSINVRNLSDKEYYATCLSRGDCFPGEVRSVNLSTKYSF
ncbi:TonB-dependent siderophore receptor [Agaribacter marinus]|uniref:Ferrisiderophore receptor n=1 Tax=Agaribacter marinus TaxID=1431249 RepID=A0AA37WHI9_9ALTE|nr:TonB-dependent siderophore receptor [Agaribacter marinus]GLR70098.1 ferrisiderophore receptor [Agaribacter marinus]